MRDRTQMHLENLHLLQVRAETAEARIAELEAGLRAVCQCGQHGQCVACRVVAGTLSLRDRDE